MTLDDLTPEERAWGVLWEALTKELTDAVDLRDQPRALRAAEACKLHWALASENAKRFIALNSPPKPS